MYIAECSDDMSVVQLAEKLGEGARTSGGRGGVGGGGGMASFFGVCGGYY